MTAIHSTHFTEAQKQCILDLKRIILLPDIDNTTAWWILHQITDILLSGSHGFCEDTQIERVDRTLNFLLDDVIKYLHGLPEENQTRVKALEILHGGGHSGVKA